MTSTRWEPSYGDDDLPFRGAGFDGLVRRHHRIEVVLPGIQPGRQLACLNQRRRLGEDLPVMGAAAPGQERQQGEDTRVGGSTETESRQAVRTPAENAEDMARVRPHRLKRLVQRRPADRVEDDVESLS